MILSNSQNIEGALLLLLTVIALAVGFAKGNFFLSKTVQRSVDNSHGLTNNLLNHFIGWCKILGIRGFIIIGIMVSLGIFLGGDISPLPNFYRGLIRIAIGIALLVGATHFVKHIKENKSKESK
jgi:hypothetical protein